MTSMNAKKKRRRLSLPPPWSRRARAGRRDRLWPGQQACISTAPAMSPPSMSSRASLSASAGWWKKAACVTARARMCAFVVTDGKRTVPVDYDGVLPALFREGQGVVAIGALDAQRHLRRHRSARQA